MFVAATVDQGGNVVNTCKAQGLPTLLCRAHRINSSVLWALGIAGSEKKCQHADMKNLIGKADALVGVFTHSSVNNDALRVIQKDLNDEQKAHLVQLQLDTDNLEKLGEEEPTSGEDSDGEESQDQFGTRAVPSRVGRKQFDVLNPLRRQDTR